MLGGCTLLSVKNDTSPTLSMMDAAVRVPAVRMLRCSIWLSSLKASALGLPPVWTQWLQAKQKLNMALKEERIEGLPIPPLVLSPFPWERG